ncbi:MAG: hypothetical protein ICV73_23685 [Acetobacteraceae bacterium]|nr:hypothetical protein [Acetobacteraceae bacterium]
MRDRKARLAAVPLGLALALAARPAEAQNLGDRIGAALNRGAQAAGRTAERASSATGAAADRGLGWAQRKVRGENGGRGNSCGRER